MYRAFSSCAVLAVAVAGLAPVGVAGARATQMAPHPVSVIVKTVEPGVLQGELMALSMAEGAIIQTEGGETQRIPIRDIVRVSTVGGATDKDNETTLVTLSGGDVLYGRVRGTEGDRLTVETIDLGRVALPLEAVRQLETPQAALTGYEESVRRFNRQCVARDDCVLLTNGDVLRGFVTSIGGDDLSIENGTGETRVPWRRVIAARLASPSRATAEKPFVILRLRHSGTLTATDIEWSGDAVEAQLACGPRVRTDARRVASVDAIGGRWEWLAQHTPISYEHTPMMSLDWHYRRDQNVLGRPMRVAGETFDHGIGVHSRSSLTYDLQGEYREFVTSLGLDDDSGPYADVSVLILVDGKRRFAQAHVRPGKLIGPVRLDVTCAKRVELIVEFGDNGDLQDRFNWIDTALIKN